MRTNNNGVNSLLAKDTMDSEWRIVLQVRGEVGEDSKGVETVMERVDWRS